MHRLFKYSVFISNTYISIDIILPVFPTWAGRKVFRRWKVSPHCPMLTESKGVAADFLFSGLEIACDEDEVGRSMKTRWRQKGQWAVTGGLRRFSTPRRCGPGAAGRRACPWPCREPLLRLPDPPQTLGGPDSAGDADVAVDAAGAAAGDDGDGDWPGKKERKKINWGGFAVWITLQGGHKKGE